MTQTSTALDLTAGSGPPPPPLLLVDRELRRERLSVAFRLLLAIPQFIVLYVLTIAAWIVLLVGWLAALVLGRLPEPLARYLTHFLRYSTRFQAFCYLLTDRYPPFRLSAEDYPVRVEVTPGRLNRLAVLFRIFLAIPASIVVTLVTAGWWVVGLLIWLVVLAMGQTPEALFDATTAVLRYSTRFNAYMLLLTAAYPKGLFGDQPAPSLPPPALAQAEMPQPPPAEPALAPEGPLGAEAPLGAQPGPGAEPAPAVPPMTTAPSQPRGLLVLSRGARQLVVAFLVLGILQYATGAIVGVLGAGRTVSTAQARQDLSTSFETLVSQTQTYQQARTTCASRPDAEQLSCVQAAERDWSAALETFADDVEGIDFPAGSRDEAARVASTGHQFAASRQRLASVSSAEEYNQMASGSEQVASAFDQQYQALVNSLSA
jgi:Domain of unknown function (DUF4389)